MLLFGFVFFNLFYNALVCFDLLVFNMLCFGYFVCFIVFYVKCLYIFIVKRLVTVFKGAIEVKVIIFIIVIIL